MNSGKPHSSSAPIVTKQKQSNTDGKSKLVHTNSAKKTQQQQQQPKKRTLVSKPPTVNGASNSFKHSISTHTNGADKSCSNSNGNVTTKQDRRVIGSLSTLSNTTETVVVKDNSRYVLCRSTMMYC